jgi:hypothetical protein
MPPPKNNPLPVAVPVILSWANRPTAKVPKIPFTRWTDKAPTGSSIFALSKKITANTTRIPATAPIINELTTLTKAQGAVIATRPAKQPFSVIPKSGFPSISHDIMDRAQNCCYCRWYVVNTTREIAAGTAAMLDPD